MKDPRMKHSKHSYLRTSIQATRTGMKHLGIYKIYKSYLNAFRGWSKPRELAIMDEVPFI